MKRPPARVLILLAAGGAIACNALLNIDQSPKVASCGDTSDDPNNCGHCGAVCPSGVCQQGACLTIAHYGVYAVTGTGFGTLTPVFGLGDAGRAQLAGVQIHVTRPGLLVHLGMLTAYGGLQGVLGLYADEGGAPGALVASTAELEVAGDVQYSNPQPTVVDVVHPTPIGAGFYWILSIWRSDAWFETVSGDPPSCDVGCVPWYQLYVPYGLPDVATPEASLMQLQPTPILYADLAE